METKKTTFAVNFFLKKSKLLKNGEAPICMRITVNGKRAEVQIKRSIELEKWNSIKGCSIGKDKRHQEINLYLDTVRNKVFQIHRQLEADGKPITADIIKNIYYGGQESPRMLIETFDEHNMEYRELMDKEYSKGTVLRYERTVRYLKEFLKEQYKTTDIPLKSINYEFITQFEHFIKTNKGCAQNATVKYLKNLKKITKTALLKKWISEDPFTEIRFKQTKTNRDFLNEAELRMILCKDIEVERIQTVRDIFIFCCLTGLSFTDVKNLREDHLVQDNDGKWWIRKAREKTDNMCDIPLLEIPKLILDKYNSNPIHTEKGLLLPVPTNQRMNAYLKEIADICNIKKNLSTHVARHITLSYPLKTRNLQRLLV